MRLAALRQVDAQTAAAGRLCGLALDAGLLTVSELRRQLDACQTRADLDGVLLGLLADVALAGGGSRLEGGR